MKNFISHISVDWLQLNCRYIDPVGTIIPTGMILKLQDYQTKHFKKVYILYTMQWDEMATLACEPHSSVLKNNMVLLKINNKFLYNPNLQNMVMKLLDDLKLIFVSITRIDLAADFNFFEKYYNPEKFIFDFLQQKIFKTGKAKFSVYGETNRRKKTKLRSNYLRFGSETSEVSYYLYNKTIELEQVKNKPYIRELWKKIDLDTKKDIWRLEFSIKSNLKAAIEEETGEYICNLNHLNILLENNVLSLYKAMFEKHFNFVKSAELKKDSNLSRAKKINLLNFVENTKFRIERISEKKESNRADKIFLKKLKEFNSEMRGSDILFEQEIGEKVNEILIQYANSRALLEWAEKKLAIN